MPPLSLRTGAPHFQFRSGATDLDEDDSIVLWHSSYHVYFFGLFILRVLRVKMWYLGDNSNQSADDSCDDDDSSSSYRRRLKSKRGIFPKSATSILKAWLFQNLAVRACIHTIPLHYSDPWGVSELSGESTNLKGGSEDTLSAPSSSIANAHNEIYAIYTQKNGFLKKNMSQ